MPQQNNPTPLVPSSGKSLLSGQGCAPAKAILLGEHFVVYGVPAIAIPLPALQIEVALSSATFSPSPPFSSAAPSSLPPTSSSPSASFATQVQLHLSSAAPLADLSHLYYCLLCCAQLLGGPSPEQLQIRLHSALPPAAGLGSSAALAVAVARAYADLCQQPLSPQQLRHLAHCCEQQVHGRPSGIDVETVLAEGPLRFVRSPALSPSQKTANSALPNASSPHVTPLQRPKEMGLLLIDSETRSSTRQMVARVAAWRQQHPSLFQQLAQQAQSFVSQAEDALSRGDLLSLADALNGTQLLLDQIGVNTPTLQEIVDLARQHGAGGAKLTGSGGGGCVLALCQPTQLSQLAHLLQQHGLQVLQAAPL